MSDLLRERQKALVDAWKIVAKSIKLIENLLAQAFILNVVVPQLQNDYYAPLSRLVQK